MGYSQASSHLGMQLLYIFACKYVSYSPSYNSCYSVYHQSCRKDRMPFVVQVIHVSSIMHSKLIYSDY